MTDLFGLEQQPQTCIHSLDVTLWGLWMATGCRVGLAIRACCVGHQLTERKEP